MFDNWHNEKQKNIFTEFAIEADMTDIEFHIMKSHVKQQAIRNLIQYAKFTSWSR
jgi:hypothetical protein